MGKLLIAIVAAVVTTGIGLAGASASEGTQPAGPDALLKAATLVVTEELVHQRAQRISSPAKLAAMVDEAILPLVNFDHMARLAVGRNWRLASPVQQDALTAEFRTLLVRTYSSVLSSYRGQAIEYKPLRLAPGESDVTVKSLLRQPSAEPMSIDYDMEKTAAGWKVYDIKVAGISLITSHQSTFARSVSEGGVDGLIASLKEKNRASDSGRAGVARPFFLIYTAIESVLRAK